MALDGKSTGPSSFTGPIGKALSECDKLPIIEFESIPSEKIDIDEADLSTDQKYLLQKYRSVSSGHCDESLAYREPGNISLARWLTTANRLLRLYVSTPVPSDKLICIVNYIMKVYVPMWFMIKRQTKCIYGAQHVFETIKIIQNLRNDIKTIVLPCVQRNAYFAHPENVLLSMIHDENVVMQKLGWRRILKVRENASKQKKMLRAFLIPRLNFNANSYTEMIDWTEEITEPPVTKNMTLEDVQRSSQEGSSTPLLISTAPCHSQAVERHIKLITEASGKVMGEESRDGFVRAVLKSRSLCPKFESKYQFK